MESLDFPSPLQSEKHYLQHDNQSSNKVFLLGLHKRKESFHYGMDNRQSNEHLVSLVGHIVILNQQYQWLGLLVE